MKKHRLLCVLLRLRRGNFSGRRDCRSLYHSDNGFCLFRRPRGDRARTVHNGFDLPLPQQIAFSEGKLCPISGLKRQAGQVRIRAACSLQLNRAMGCSSDFIGVFTQPVKEPLLSPRESRGSLTDWQGGRGHPLPPCVVFVAYCDTVNIIIHACL